MKKFLLFYFLFFSLSVRADCIPVEGLSFEKIGFNTLLIIKDNINWGTMVLATSVPDGKLEFRFFTPKICDGYINNQLHINKILFNVQTIRPFN